MRVTCGDFRPVYDPSVGEERAWYVNDHTFVRDAEGVWHLFGITHEEPMAPFEEMHFAHATAPALCGPWTKQRFALSADSRSEETHLWAPHVVVHDGLYWMFYCVGGSSPAGYRIHLATSTDCTNWERVSANPLIVDGYEARDPMVVRIEDRWVLYYTATSTSEGGHFVVVAAESDDLLSWRGRRIVYRDQMHGTMGGPTESPFVFTRGSLYYLSIGPDWAGLVSSKAETGRYDAAAYRRTRLLASRDPFRFDLDGQVATIDAHAAEFIVDEQGAWWVSHAGWGQGGVFLAPLSWND